MTSTDKDLEKVVSRSEDIKKKFSAGGPLKRFIEDGQLLISIVKDCRAGVFRKIPFGTIAAVVFTLIYVFDPFNLVPDFLPILGQLDDAAVVAACLILIEHDLYTYKLWKQDQNKKWGLKSAFCHINHRQVRRYNAIMDTGCKTSL